MVYPMLCHSDNSSQVGESHGDKFNNLFRSNKNNHIIKTSDNGKLKFSLQICCCIAGSLFFLSDFDFQITSFPSHFAVQVFMCVRACLRACRVIVLSVENALIEYLFHWYGTGNYVEGVVNGRTGSGPVRSTSCETPHDTFKIASWNIGTMRGRSSEIVETITRRNIDLCCVQEVRWRGASARHIIGKDSRYKFFWVGNNQGTSGVGVLLAEKWVDKVYDIKRVSDRIMLIKLLVGEVVLTVLSVYAPQTGLEESTKDAFYDSLQTVISELPDK